MTKLELWTGEKTYITPIGTIQTPADVAEKFPGTTLANMAFVIETDEQGQVALSEPMNLSLLRDRYGIEAELSEAEAIAALEDIINNPPEPEAVPTAEERIAAALEAQNQSLSGVAADELATALMEGVNAIV